MRKLFWLLSTIITYTLAYLSILGYGAATFILFLFYSVMTINNFFGLATWSQLIKIPSFYSLAARFQPPVPLWLISLGNIGVSFFLVANGAFWLAGLSFIFAVLEYELFGKAEKIK